MICAPIYLSVSSAYYQYNSKVVASESEELSSSGAAASFCLCELLNRAGKRDLGYNTI